MLADTLTLMLEIGECVDEPLELNEVLCDTEVVAEILKVGLVLWDTVVVMLELELEDTEGLMLELVVSDIEGVALRLEIEDVVSDMLVLWETSVVMLGLDEGVDDTVVL